MAPEPGMFGSVRSRFGAAQPKVAEVRKQRFGFGFGCKSILFFFFSLFCFPCFFSFGGARSFAGKKGNRGNSTRAGTFLL